MWVVAGWQVTAGGENDTVLLATASSRQGSWVNSQQGEA
jgi:hypothetical protein